MERLSDYTDKAKANFNVPKWHKKIVLKQIKHSEKKDFFPLDDLDGKIKF